MILSHAGGTLPYVISRPAGRLGRGTKEYDEWMDAASDFYFDVAVSCHANVFTLLEKVAKPDHILFGSDTPFAPEVSIANNVWCLDDYKFARPEMRDEINFRNALELFPRLRQYYKAQAVL